MSRRSKQIAASIMLVIFAFYYANICLFYHSHIINGTTIVHSHIHTKAHAQSGTHTPGELTLISFLSSFQSLKSDTFTVSFEAVFFLMAVILPLVETKTRRNLLTSIPLRAPPALV